ncbi:1-(5-phosphoribosyl)-5-[(5-phosphoribosylamino)methylideneamino]imidazole-4-carboxamide isomerase [Buchnera aphidicola (Neophyllaphis podocarpi)]|uniref:1-(5-phosphoribosyl)-5-[(5- phosphoribosylamino)methylideneamino]imidazole-4- carboxamide isomerase n=1 Tax=Buchnera aphidicola TaxID=9 RepID=UPI0031B83B31
MIIPSIDLLDGKVVRLYKGNYNNKKLYNSCPFKLVKKYEKAGVKCLHLVDLSGAKNFLNRQISLISQIVSSTKMNIQVGGGVRTIKDVDNLFLAGVKRVVIGSMAVINKIESKNIFQYYSGNMLVLAIDIVIDKRNKSKNVLINGWKSFTSLTLEYLIDFYSNFGLKYVLCTDISRDGTLIGPNIDLYKEISNKFKLINFQASGGVSSLQDIICLKSSGVKNIIIGKALLENKFTILEAINVSKKNNTLFRC